jgi:hypothetical protein
MNPSLAVMIAIAVTAPQVDQPDAAWRFDPGTLLLSGGDWVAHFRPLGEMHGLVIEKLGDAGSPTAEGRAFLNLEHYLAKGRWGEYLPRHLDQTAVLSRKGLTIQFPQPKDWPLTTELSYSFETPGAIDARLDFTFTGALSQFEVYFTSYFAPQYERSVRVQGQWMRPEIGPKEQLLIPRDDKIADRYQDGRWEFLKGRTRLAQEHFEIPVMISKDDATGWTIVQMIEPGACTHIAPNRFAVGHNFIIGGWDVVKGDKRSARIRLIAGKNLSEADVERAYHSFADTCRQAKLEAGPPTTRP